MWRHIGICLYIVLLLAFRTNNNDGVLALNEIPLWTWDCVNERCVPSKATAMVKLQSLETCNMLCASLQLWPQPTGHVSLSTTAVPVRADLFQIQGVSAPNKIIHDHLLEAFELFRKDLRRLENGSEGFADWRGVAVHLTVEGNDDPRMRLDTDESYAMRLRPKDGYGSSLDVEINATAFCGARHGLETLLQLVWMDPYVGSLLALEAAKVEDAPRFGYRGLMLDTARNFYPVEDLLRTIDAMAANKLNTFHWHISDSQSFPLQVGNVPQLAELGAYGQGASYSSREVNLVVHHAKLRGVRVLIEVDTPAHVGRAWSWGPSKGYGDLIYCFDDESSHDYCKEPPCAQLNPRNSHVYEILETLYSQIIQSTGVDDVFHLGGSEIIEHCWQTHFDADPMDLWLQFTRSALVQLEFANGKLPNLTIMWESSLSEHLKNGMKEYVHGIGLQIRRKNVARGMTMIMSNEDPWDLNSGMGSHTDSDGAPYNSWQRVYEHRPWSRGSELVLGGEATVWSGTLGAGGLDARLWPRAAALAERLWSDRAEGATRTVHARMDVQRSRLVARGIHATPIWSMWCTHNTFTCG